MSGLVVRLNARHPEALADFFVRALGFEPDQSDGASVSLTLGASRLRIIRCVGEDYPSFVPGWSLLFQHFAMTTNDMAAAMARLDRVGGWTAISRGGPQTLPASSGGVTAFKFRSSEGHPLELIAFEGDAEGAAPRIDHSAISVADTETSIAFYRTLGLTVGSATLNQGPAQDRLDGLSGAVVEVTALQLPGGPPHLELLCYRGEYPRTAGVASPGDIAATQLAWTTKADLPRLARSFGQAVERFDRPAGTLVLRDPNGHLLRLTVSPGAR